MDAVSGATLKYANSGLAGGSYHDVDAVDADSQVKALGATYPVYVTDMSKLDASLEVKADDSKTIGIVSGREKTITPTEVTGQYTLFCASSYSWMKLADKPARYKTMTAAKNGSVSFGAVSGRATTVDGVTGTASYYTHHGNFIEVRLDGVTIEEAVSGVLILFLNKNMKCFYCHGFCPMAGALLCAQEIVPYGPANQRFADCGAKAAA